MVYPVLQEKFARDKKNIAPIYPALLLRLHCPLALMESAHSDLIRSAASKEPKTPSGSLECRCYLFCHHLNFIPAIRCKLLSL